MPLGIKQISILALLTERPGCSIDEIIYYTKTKRSAVVVALDPLEEKDLVHRGLAKACYYVSHPLKLSFKDQSRLDSLRHQYVGLQPIPSPDEFLIHEPEPPAEDEVARATRRLREM